MMSKLRPITNENTSLTLYKTLVIPIIDYCDIIYDCLTKRDSDMLQRLQNGACRIILQRKKRTPTSDMHRELKLFRLVDRRHMRTMEFMYKIVNELLLASVQTLHESGREQNKGDKISNQSRSHNPNISSGDQ